MMRVFFHYCLGAFAEMQPWRGYIYQWNASWGQVQLKGPLCRGESNCEDHYTVNIKCSSAQSNFIFWFLRTYFPIHCSPWTQYISEVYSEDQLGHLRQILQLKWWLYYSSSQQSLLKRRIWIRLNERGSSLTFLWNLQDETFQRLETLGNNFSQLQPC